VLIQVNGEGMVISSTYASDGDNMNGQTTKKHIHFGKSRLLNRKLQGRRLTHCGEN